MVLLYRQIAAIHINYLNTSIILRRWFLLGEHQFISTGGSILELWHILSLKQDRLTF